MATYDFDITAAEVAACVAHAGTIDADSDPDSTQVGTWITQFCAEVGAALHGAGVSDPSVITSSADDDLYQLVRMRVQRRVAAEWLMANQREETDYTIRLVEEYDRFVRGDLVTRASRVLSSTGGRRGVSHSFDTTTTRTYWPRKTSFR